MELNFQHRTSIPLIQQLVYDKMMLFVFASFFSIFSEAWSPGQQLASSVAASACGLVLPFPHVSAAEARQFHIPTETTSGCPAECEQHFLCREGWSGGSGSRGKVLYTCKGRRQTRDHCFSFHADHPGFCCHFVVFLFPSPRSSSYDQVIVFCASNRTHMVCRSGNLGHIEERRPKL